MLSIWFIIAGGFFLSWVFTPSSKTSYFFLFGIIIDIVETVVMLVVTLLVISTTIVAIGTQIEIPEITILEIR